MEKKMRITEVINKVVNGDWNEYDYQDWSFEKEFENGDTLDIYISDSECFYYNNKGEQITDIYLDVTYTTKSGRICTISGNTTVGKLVCWDADYYIRIYKSKIKKILNEWFLYYSERFNKWPNEIFMVE